MAQCTAPVNGHRTQRSRDNCPACRGGRYSSYGGYSPRSYSPPSYSSSGSSGGGQRSVGGGGGRSVRPRWSPAGSSVSYTDVQARALEPIRESVEKLANVDLRDVFLCHAWDDRKGAAKELHDLLVSHGVKVWFSENDILLGVPMMRAIDKGLATSRIGIVLVTPELLKKIQNEGVAERELSVLLAGQRLIPILHNTTFEALNLVSPLLASRGGLNTKDETMAEVAARLAETVKI